MLTCQPGEREDPAMAGTRDPDLGPGLDALVEAWLAGHRTENTRAAYRHDLVHFRLWCDGDGCAFVAPPASALERYRVACEAQGASPASVARRLSAVGSFLGYAARTSAPGAPPRAAKVTRPSVTTTSATHVLAPTEVAALLAAADAMGPKASVLIRLLLLDGLKVGEAVALNAEHVRGRPPRMRLDLRRDTDTPGRVVALDAQTAVALHRYLAGRKRGPVLVNERRPRDLDRLTRFGVDFVVKRVAEAARIDARVSANTLRRHYVIAAHERGVGLDEIRRSAGHSDVRTTRRYLPNAGG
jgi:site-specific recombinase XerD